MSKWLIIGIIAVVVVAVVMTQQKVKTGEEKTSSEDTGVQLFFVDQNFNPVSEKKQSAVYLGGTTIKALENVFYMRMDLTVRNTGAVNNQISIIDITAYDKNNVSVNKNQLYNAFNCIMNKPKIVQPTQSYTWTTSPNGAEGCGDAVWVPIPYFETLDQPIRIVASLKGEFDVFGIRREDVRVTELSLWFSKEPIQLGAYEGSLLIPGTEGGQLLMKECAVGSVQECAMQDGVCAGAKQTCDATGLWQGCTAAYKSIPGYMEVSEYETSLAACKDGKDNDCDGFVDRLDTTDCPTKIVKFRTGADISKLGDKITALPRNSPYYHQWVVVELNGEMKTFGMEGYGSISGGCVGNTMGVAKDMFNSANVITSTPKNNLKVAYYSAYGKLYIGEAVGSSCYYVYGTVGSQYRCLQGSQDWMDGCLNRFPSQHWNYLKCGVSPCQETQVDY